MNYRHIYHAGNICDVVKHIALTMVLAHLRMKEAGFCALDTHAGCGLYDLEDARAAKTSEAQQGVLQLVRSLAEQGEKPEELKEYLEILQKLNPAWNVNSYGQGELRYYPGSPRLIASLLRPQDRLIACELHEEDSLELRRNMRGFAQAQIHRRDGYEALTAFLPPSERRGVVLIDPPYEDAQEFEKLPARLAEAWKRWPQGIYMLWYPIKDRPTIWSFHEALRNLGLSAGGEQGQSKLLCAEFVYQDEIRSDRLNGSGLIILNPPWQLADRLRSVFLFLRKVLGAQQTGCEVSFL